MKRLCPLAAIVAVFGLIPTLHAATKTVTIVTGTTVSATHTPASSFMGIEIPAKIQYDVGYATTPDVDFTGLNAGDILALDVVAPSGYRFQIAPEGAYQLSTYNRWFAFGENVGTGGFSSVSFSLLDLVGNAPTPTLNTTLVYQPSNNASNFLYSAGLNSLEALSFSGFRFTGTLANSVNAVTLPFLETAAFSVSDNDYQGQPPPADLGVFTVVPEPSTFFLLSLAGPGWLAWRRRKRTGLTRPVVPPHPLPS